jgi:hypothetical protein
LSDLIPAIKFPEATVSVLSAEMTFWEKVTAIHAEAGRVRSAEALEGQSRHWHDVAVLADQDIGRRALAQRDLLEEAVRYKKVFFHFGSADYDACLEGRCRLVPPEPIRSILRADHQAMAEKGYLDREAPSFEEILRRLERLEVALRAT